MSPLFSDSKRDPHSLLIEFKWELKRGLLQQEAGGFGKEMNMIDKCCLYEKKSI